MTLTTRTLKRLNFDYCMKEQPKFTFSTFSIQKSMGPILACHKICQGHPGSSFINILINKLSGCYIPSLKAIGHSGSGELDCSMFL